MTDSEPWASLTATEAPVLTPQRRKVEQKLLLGEYVDLVAPDDYTPEAKATLLAEMEHFANDICQVTKLSRRADGNAEKVLRRHVADSVWFLRSRRSDGWDRLADWSKWIGFAFVGFTVDEWITIHNEKPISGGSVAWLTIDLVVSVALLVTGFLLDRPWSAFRRLRRK